MVAVGSRVTTTAVIPETSGNFYGLLGLVALDENVIDVRGRTLIIQ